MTSPQPRPSLVEIIDASIGAVDAVLRPQHDPVPRDRLFARNSDGNLARGRGLTSVRRLVAHLGREHGYDTLAIAVALGLASHSTIVEHQARRLDHDHTDALSLARAALRTRTSPAWVLRSNTRSTP